jgi:6-phosphogluconolactonase
MDHDILTATHVRLARARYGFARLLARLIIVWVAMAALSAPSHAASVVYVGNADSQDLSVLKLGSDGVLTPFATVSLQQPAQTGSSVLIALTPDRKRLYASFLHGAQSSVAAFAIDPHSGLLSRLGEATPLVATVAYIATDGSGRFLLGASYAGNQVSVNRILPNGVIGDSLQVIPTASQAHCILTDPGNHYVLHTALGGDLVYQERFDARTGRLTPNAPPSVNVPSKAGPRFLTFAPDARFVYVVDELDGAIHVFPFDASRGTLGPQVQLASALPPGFTGRPWAADIHLTPNGKFLYASERTTSTLAAFRVDAHSGALEFIDTYPTVRQPRAFNIDSSGHYLLASGQLSNSVRVYAIDAASGRLTSLAEYPVGNNPTWVALRPLS